MTIADLISKQKKVGFTERVAAKLNKKKTAELKAKIGNQLEDVKISQKASDIQKALDSKVSKRLQEVKDGYTPIKGKDYEDGKSIKGDKGEPGYTPIKGKDYFDGKDGKDGKNGKDGKSVKGEKGDKGEKGEDGKSIVGPVGPKGKDGKDGITTVINKKIPLDKKDHKEIVKGIEALPYDDRLDVLEMKNIAEAVFNYAPKSKVIPISTAVEDGKVKVNSGGNPDYLINKIKAGDNVTVEQDGDQVKISAEGGSETDPVWNSEKSGYLKLDASNDPITGDLLIQPSTDSAVALKVNDKDSNNVFTVDTINNGTITNATHLSKGTSSDGFTTNTTINDQLNFSANETANVSGLKINLSTPTGYAVNLPNVSYYGLYADVSMKGAFNLNYLRGLYFKAGWSSTGTISKLYANQNQTTISAGTATEVISSYNGTIVLSIATPVTVTNSYGTRNNVFPSRVGSTITMGSHYNFYSEGIFMGPSVTCTNLYHYFAATPTLISATVTNQYGLYMQNISGATNNYAIYTGTGLNLLGDQLKIDLVADKIGLIVQAHSTQTANLQEWQNSSGNVLAQIEADGTLKFLGTATTFNDANVGSLVLQTGGTLPGIVEWLDSTGGATGIYTRGFATGEKGGGSIEIPHDYKEGSDLTFHVHWGVNDAPTGTDYVKWQLTYSISRDDVVFPASTVIVKETATDTQYKNIRSDFTAITGTNFKIGDQFNFQIERIAATGDAFAGEALVMTLGFHYECDTLGSHTISTK